MIQPFDCAMPELLNELVVARVDNLLKKVSKAYAQVDLLILDEWLLRTLMVQQAFDLLDIIEACGGVSLRFFLLLSIVTLGQIWPRVLLTGACFLHWLLQKCFSAPG